MRKFLYEIRPSDVRKGFFRLPNCQSLLGQGWGLVQPVDIGKRLYLVGNTIQIENCEQKNARKNSV